MLGYGGKESWSIDAMVKVGYVRCFTSVRPCRRFALENGTIWSERQGSSWSHFIYGESGNSGQGSKWVTAKFSLLRAEELDLEPIRWKLGVKYKTIKNVATLITHSCDRFLLARQGVGFQWGRLSSHRHTSDRAMVSSFILMLLFRG